LVEKVSDDPPDLIVEDESGRRIGIECTDSGLEGGLTSPGVEEKTATPQSQSWVEARQNRCRQAWAPYLRAAGYALILDDNDRGPLPLDRLRKPVADLLKAKLVSTARPSDQPVRLEIPDLGFFAILEPSKVPDVYFPMWCGDNTLRMAESICGALKKKLGRLRSSPEGFEKVSKAVLVIYLNLTLGVRNLDEVITATKEYLQRGEVGRPFDEIWLCNEYTLNLIWPLSGELRESGFHD
jgi:hypothetical protein